MGEYLIEIADRETVEQKPGAPAIPLPQAANYLGQTDDILLLSRQAAELYDARRIRGRFFQAELFAEPAWDILLDLFVAKVSGLRVSTKAACIAAAVPETTALRWLILLVEQGLIERNDDKSDRRRSWVVLTEFAFKGMQSYLRGLTSSPIRNFKAQGGSGGNDLG